MSNNRDYLLIDDLIGKCNEFNNNLINYKDIWNDMNIYNSERNKFFFNKRNLNNNEIIQQDYITYSQFIQYLTSPFSYEINKIFKFHILQIPNYEKINFERTVKNIFRYIKSENEFSKMLILLGIKIKKENLHLLLNLYNSENEFRSLYILFLFF